MPDEVLRLYARWMSYRDEDVDASSFRGIQLRQLADFKSCFKINVKVFELCEDGATYPVFKSTERFDATMYVNHYENHLSYIRDFQTYAKKYKCQLCDRLFDH